MGKRRGYGAVNCVCSIDVHLEDLSPFQQCQCARQSQPHVSARDSPSTCDPMVVINTVNPDGWMDRNKRNDIEDSEGLNLEIWNSAQLYVNDLIKTDQGWSMRLWTMDQSQRDLPTADS